MPSATITTTQAVVGWTAGDTETNWEVDYKKTADTNWTTVTATTNPTKTITGLTANTEYDVRVRAVISGKYSNYTAVVSFKTDAA